jgi:hypothetical protein
VRTAEGDGKVPVGPRVVAESNYADTANATSHLVPLPEPEGG